MNVLFVGGPLHGSRVEIDTLPWLVRHIDGFAYRKIFVTTSIAKRPAQWLYAPAGTSFYEILQLMKELGE